MTLKSDEIEETLDILRRARSAHIRWRSYAHGLVNGVPVSEDKLPVHHTECAFGRWYYGEGQQRLGDLAIFQDLEGPHEMLHGIYARIHEAVQNGKKGKARRLFEELQAVSRDLVDQLDLLEQQIRRGQL
ncbi:CZB domain-containing protein [Thiohalospira sp.]|uniref:CZB domain-containing protein n=1 Tax=Thiohalospira sp. TaxID=3080549 RepID=UPI00397F76DB